MKILFLFLISFSALAQFPLSPDKLKRVMDNFYDKEQTLSISKLDSFKKNLKKMRGQIKKNIQQFEANNSKMSTKEIEEIAKENKFVKNTKRIYKNWVDEVLKINDPIQRVEFLATVLDLKDAVKSEITPVNSNKHSIHKIYEFSKNYKISKETSKRYGEAYNLLNEETGRYYSQKELQTKISTGQDISLLNPPKENGVIESIDDISKVDVFDRYRNGNNEMHRGLPVHFPKSKIGFFTSFRKTQSRPKIMFETRDSFGKKLHEYKMKMGKELHSEATAASLGVSLGLFHDLSQYVRMMKIYIGDMTYEEFAIEFSDYFPYKNLDVIIHSKGSDPKHGNYLIINEGLIETRFKSKELRRVGPFYPGNQKGKRETRALMIYNLWIHNTDLKQGENNKTLIRYLNDKKKVFYSQHDVGFSFGKYGKEKPTDFTWKIVKSNNKKEISFDYRSFVPNQGIDHVSYFDAKWMVRKIAQLTRKQITTAVKFGHWPNQSPFNFEQLIIEKLISRRNDMVTAFNLLGERLSSGSEIELIPFNKDIIKDAIPPSKKLENYTVDFRPTIKYNWVNPGLKALREGIVDGTASITRALTKVDITPWIGLDDGIIAQVLVGTGKKIIENPNPRSLKERFIVRESFRMGTRLGYGFILSADSAYVKEYTLIYSVETKEEVDTHGKWIVDVTMPYRVMQNFLPENHILITENYIENRGRVKLATPFIGLGNDSSISRINLSRVILSKKKKQVVNVLVDTSNYTELADEVYTKLGLAKLKYFSVKKKSGNLDRDIYTLDKSDKSFQAIDELIMNSNPEYLQGFRKNRRVESDFLETSRNLNLFGFISHKDDIRTDEYKLYSVNESGSLLQLEHQLQGKYNKSRSWSFIKDGEERASQVTMSTSFDQNHKMIKPYINMQFTHHDLNSTAKEMDEGYIPFFNGVANDSEFIPFDAKNLSFTGDYGHLNFKLNEQIYSEGIKKLLTISETEFWAGLNKILGIKNLKKLKMNRIKRVGTKLKTTVIHKEYINYQGFKYNKKIVFEHAKAVLQKLKDAQSEKKTNDKIVYLMKALTESIPQHKHSQSPIILAALNGFIGEKNYHLMAEIESPSYEENKMPGRITPFNSQGVRRDIENREFIKLQMINALTIYNMF